MHKQWLSGLSSGARDMGTRLAIVAALTKQQTITNSAAMRNLWAMTQVSTMCCSLILAYDGEAANWTSILQWRRSGSTIMVKVTVNYTGMYLPWSSTANTKIINEGTATTSNITQERMINTRPEIPSALCPVESPEVSIMMGSKIFWYVTMSLGYSSLMTSAYVFIAILCFV